MDDLISRKDLLAEYDRVHIGEPGQARKLIEEAPRVDAVEVVHSKWDTVFYERNGELATYSHVCPICKYHYKNVWGKGYNYCPNCGAKMDGDGNG